MATQISRLNIDEAALSSKDVGFADRLYVFFENNSISDPPFQ